MASKVVLANGCFDLFHYGHLMHLEAAKGLGDQLIVSVTNDWNVNKGVGRPIFDHFKRAAIIKSLRCVDGVIIVCSSIEALKRINPDTFVKGNDYSLDKMNEEDVKFCIKNNINIAFTSTEKFSSTEIIKEVLDEFG